MFSYAEKREVDFLKRTLTQFLDDCIKTEIKEQTYLLRYEDWANEWMVKKHASPRITKTMSTYCNKQLREDILQYLKEKTNFCLKKTESSLHLFRVKNISNNVASHVKQHVPIYVTGSLQKGWRDSLFPHIELLHQEELNYIADPKDGFVCIGPLKTDEKTDFESLNMAKVIFVWAEEGDLEAFIEIGMALQMQKQLFVSSPTIIPELSKNFYTPFVEYQCASTPEEAWNLFVLWYRKTFNKAFLHHEVTEPMKGLLHHLLRTNHYTLRCSVDDLDFSQVQQLINYFQNKDVLLPFSLWKKLKKGTHHYEIIDSNHPLSEKQKNYLNLLLTTNNMTLSCPIDTLTSTTASHLISFLRSRKDLPEQFVSLFADYYRINECVEKIQEQLGKPFTNKMHKLAIRDYLPGDSFYKSEYVILRKFYHKKWVDLVVKKMKTERNYKKFVKETKN